MSDSDEEKSDSSDSDEDDETSGSTDSDDDDDEVTRQTVRVHPKIKHDFFLHFSSYRCSEVNFYFFKSLPVLSFPQNDEDDEDDEDQSSSEESSDSDSD